MLLADDQIRRLVGMPEFQKLFSEQQRAISAVRNAPVSSCCSGSSGVLAMGALKRAIHNASEVRLAKVKDLLGIRTPLTVRALQGGKVKSRTI